MMNLQLGYNADIVITRVAREDEHGNRNAKVKGSCDSYLVNGLDAIKQIYGVKKDVGWQAVGKIFRKSLLLDVKFPHGYYEDCACLYLALVNCTKVAIGDYLNNYHYIVRDGSITTGKMNDMHYRAFDICDEFDSFVATRMNGDRIVSVGFKRNMVVQLLNLVKMSENEYKECFLKYRALFRRELFGYLTKSGDALKGKIVFALLCTTPKLYYLLKHK